MKKLLKRITFFIPYLIVFSGLSFAGLVSFLLIPQTKLIKNETVAIINQVKPTANPSPTPTQTPKTKPLNKITPFATATPKPTPQPTAISNNSETVIPQMNQVSVSINDLPEFNVLVSEETNQCDVLNKALSDGKISSLNLKYDPNFKTFAVYQINGIGKENSVWWTYKINGQSPNQGCSFIKAKKQDHVEWKYIGS